MIALTSSPERDWLPVFQPALYTVTFTPDAHTDFETPDLTDEGGKVKLNWPAGSDQPTALPYTFWKFGGDTGAYSNKVAAVVSNVTDIADGTTIVLDLPYVGLATTPGGTLYTGAYYAPALNFRVEVSTNGTDFGTAIVAGVAQIPGNSSNTYQFNPNAYLESVFTPAAPVTSGPDHNLFKYFRVLVGPYYTFDGTNGTPEVVTIPARVLYASELTTLSGGGTTSLSMEPSGANTSAYGSILTTISAGAVSNTITAADASKPCPPYPIHLFWLNRKGGWQSHVFDGKHEYGEDIPEAMYYQDYIGYEHKARIDGMKQAVQVFSGYIASDRYEVVKTIRSAIRVYHSDGGTMREVNIKGGSFPIRKEGRKLYECNFAFTYAEPVIIQTA